MRLARIFAGRHEAFLLTSPSVHKMAELLASRCRDESWARGAVAGLARFRVLTGYTDLEELLARALEEPASAERALERFASVLSGYAASQIAALALGAKLWFRLNGVAVPWRPLPGQAAAATPLAARAGIEPVILLALASSDLSLAEFSRLRVGDLGSLAADGRVLPDLDAEPLAIQYRPRRGRREERLTFLSYQARQALLNWLAPVRSSGQPFDLERLLLARPDGSPLSRASIARARQRGQAVIRAGNNANVELCRATGDFFRRWGMPGSRFTGPEELNEEEFF